MIRFTLQSCASADECVNLINSLSARFIKEMQRKSIADLFVSTTYPANESMIVAKTVVPSKAVHQVTFMISDKVQKETEAGKLAAEVAWFKEAVKS